MNSRLQQAHKFAIEKHEGQKRKFIDKPYTIHLENAANILWQNNPEAETDDFIAALLHDVIEDTTTELKEIGQLFGGIVMNIVSELTTDEVAKNKKGKAVYLTEKINAMSERAFTIKLCDRLDNVMCLNDEATPLKFIKRYVKETIYIIGHIDREVNDVQKKLLKQIHSSLLYLELTKKY